MAEGKKAFILYADQRGLFGKLTDDQAGKLIKHIYSYVNDENPKGDFIIELAFESIKQQLKRDLKKWDIRAEKSRQNGLLGGRPKNLDEPKEPSRLKNNLDEPKKPVKVNVTVTDNVKDTVNGNVKNIILMSEANASNALPINQKYFETAKGFYELFQKNQIQLKVKWLHLEKTKVDDFIKPIRLMIESDKRDLEDIRKVWRFLKTDEFWMKNIQSTSKLREKFDQLITQAKNTKTNGTDQKHFSLISDNAFPSIQKT